MAKIEEYVSNPELVEAMRAVKDKDSRITQNMVVGELLKARLLIPITVSEPEPATAPETASKRERKLLFHMIQNTGKQKFFLAFTDMSELKKWRDNPEQKSGILTFDDYAALVLDVNSGAAGIAIDPFGENLIMTRDMVKTLRREKRMREGGGIDLSAIYPKLYS